MDVKETAVLPLMEVLIGVARREEKLRGQLELMEMLAKAAGKNPSLGKEVLAQFGEASEQIPRMQRRLLELNSLIHWLQKVRT